MSPNKTECPKPRQQNKTKQDQTESKTNKMAEYEIYIGHISYIIFDRTDNFVHPIKKLAAISPSTTMQVQQSIRRSVTPQYNSFFVSTKTKKMKKICFVTKKREHTYSNF